MKLTENEFFDYIRCPLHYWAIYIKNLPFPNRTSFASYVNKVANSFFLQLMNGSVMSTSEMKRKWDAVCSKSNGRINANKCIEGIGLLMKMFLWAKKEQIRIADIREPFDIVTNGMHGKAELLGEMGTIAVTRPGQYQLLYLDFTRKYPDQSLVDMQLKYTMDALAFRNMYGKDIGIHVHHVNGDKDYYSFRQKEDFDRLKSAIDNIAWCIENKVFYPRESAFCATCAIKDLCRMWR